MFLELTPEMIRVDIAGYRDRIEAARRRLAKLPEGQVPYPEHKKREEARRILLAEIEHVKRLIQIAGETLYDRIGIVNRPKQD